jgi:hypothetical protein
MISADQDEAAIVGELVENLSPDELEERLIKALTGVAQQYS